MIKRKLAITFIKTITKLAINGCDKIPNELKDIFGDTSDNLLDVADDLMDSNAEKVCETVNSKIDGLIEEYDFPDDRIDNVKAEICDLLENVQHDLTLNLLCDSKCMESWLLKRYEESGSARSEYEEIPQIIPRVGKILCRQFQTSKEFIPQMLLDNRIKITQLVEGNIALIENGKISRENQEEILGLLKQVLAKLEEFGSDSDEEPDIPVIFEDYKSRWTKNMFLNDYDSATPASKYNLSLAQLYGSLDNYLVPNATWGYRVPYDDMHEERRISSADLKNHLLSDINLGKGLVILGMPGVGKSTLVSWLCNNKTNEERTIRAFSLPSIVPKIVSTVRKEDILSWIKLSEQELQESVLILDGLDEVSAIKDKEYFINELFYRLKTIPRLSIIITCRVNYIDTEKLQLSYVILHPWDSMQINKFIDLYQNHIKVEGNEQKRTVINKKTDVFGIPLITYMIVATDIMAKEDDTEVDIYDKLFAFEGGILDHQINRTDIDNPRPLDRDTKEKILDKSREIAFWMFEHGGKNDIPDVFNKIEGLRENHFYRDHFKLIRHTEGTEHMNFVHRSMYEYFAVDYFINKLRLLLDEIEHSGNGFHMYSMKLSYLLVEFCRRGAINDNSNENSMISTFLKVKLQRLFHEKKLGRDIEQKKLLYYWWEEVIANKLMKGCTYNSFANISNSEWRNTLEVEKRCATNLLIILQMVYQYFRPEENSKPVKILKKVSETNSDFREIISLYTRLITWGSELNQVYDSVLMFQQK